MEVVPQQNGRSALAQLPVKVNGLGQTHSPAGETADLTAQPTEKTLAAECPFQPFQAGSQPFGKSSHSRVPGFRIVRTAASASRIEPKFSPGESTRWKRFKPREATSNAAQQQSSSGQDGGPAAVVNSQAGVKRAACPTADAGRLPAVQQPATGPEFELALDLGLTTPAEPCTTVAQAERGGMQGNGSTPSHYCRQHASREPCLESAAQDAAVASAGSKPEGHPVTCTARPRGTGRHSQRIGGRAEQLDGQKNCGPQARESDFSLELELTGGGAAVGTDGPAGCDSAAESVSPFQLESGALNGRGEDTPVGGGQSMELSRQWVLPFQALRPALRPKQPFDTSRAAQTATLGQAKGIGQPTPSGSRCSEGGDEAAKTAQQTSASGLLKGKAGSGTCQAAAMGRSGCEAQQLTVQEPAWQPMRNAMRPEQAEPQQESHQHCGSGLQGSGCLQQNSGGRLGTNAAKPAESDSREPQATTSLQQSGPIGTAGSGAAQTLLAGLSGTPLPDPGSAAAAATATKKLPSMSSIRRRLASSRLKQPLKRAYGGAATGLEEDRPSLQAQTGLEDPCDSIEQAAPPGAARPLKRLKRAVDVAAAGSPEPPPMEAVPKSQQKSRLMPASFEAQAAAAPCEAEKASNPFVSEKSVQKNLQAKLSVLKRQPKPKPATLPAGGLGPMMRSVLAGQRQGRSTGGADTPIDLTGDEMSPLEPSERQHTTGPAATAAASAYHHPEGNTQREAMPPVGPPSNSRDAMGGSSAAAISAQSALPWWYRLPDFVPLAALADGVNPRTGAVVYIAYKDQFQEAIDSPAKMKRGTTRKATARTSSAAAGRRPGAAKKARGSGHAARKSFWARRGRFGRR